MWIYFNNKGQATTILEHGTPARVGSTVFHIFAVFEEITDQTSLDNFSATIRLTKPDLDGSSYPTLLMSPASSTFEKLSSETDTGDFENNTTYYGFLLDFGDFNDDGEPNSDILLDTDGLWKATINLIGGGVNVQGVATFEVAGTGTETPTEISYEIITNQIVESINQRALKSDVIIVIPNNSANVSSYSDGQLFYSEADKTIYKKVSGSLEVLQDFKELLPLINTKSDKSEVILTVDDIADVDPSLYEEGQMFYDKSSYYVYKLIEGHFIRIGTFDVDAQLSLDSENPVQNKVITGALQNIQEVIEGKSSSYVIEASLTISIVKTYIQHEEYEKIVDFAGNDITQAIIDGDYDAVEIVNNSFNSNNNSFNLYTWNSQYIIITAENDAIVQEESENVIIIDTIRHWAEKIKLGDIILVTETNVPDRWISHDGTQMLTFSALEIANLSNFVTTNTNQTITGKKILSNDSNEIHAALLSDGTNSITIANIENKNNKVTSLSPSSTDTQYPSAKCVYNGIQNIREVAEGKCKTFILSYGDTVASVKADIQAHPSVKAISANGTDITQAVLNGDYDYFDVDDQSEGIVFCNPLFNSNSNELNISGSYYHFILRQYDITAGGTEFKYIFDSFESSDDNPQWTGGDIILVIETDVPDRWVAGNTVFYKLETSKINLSSYVDLTSAQTITGQKTIKDTILIQSSSGNHTFKATQDTNGTLYMYFDDTIAGRFSVYSLSAKDLLPISNNNYDIGSSTYTWKDLYLSGTFYHTNYNITWDNGVIFKNSSNTTLFYVANNGQAWFYGDLIPSGTTGTKDIGSSARQWKDLYMSGSIKGAATLTQAQYDALVSGGTVDADTFYFIEEE